ncbi:MAG: hypothetical protein C4518_06975 [Desulfobacteraceae bacterium]|nr:MAG: hypothetical protein C4518_06975 [Desulfobacteraceae bacterium]
MKKFFLIFCLFSAFFTLIFISPVAACHFEDVVITADCEGFTISGRACINGNWHEGVDISYNLAVNYTDGSGIETVIPVFGFGTQILQEPGVNDCKPFEISGAWEDEFCGDVFITGTIDLVSINNSSETDAVVLETDIFFCPCGCTRTPGYWKNPKKPWPVEELTIGGVLYSKAALMEKLNLPARGDISIKLFHHLIAAMLNVINVPANNAPSIQLIIEAADAYFTDPTGCDKKCVVALKNALETFNASGKYLCD